MEKIDVLKEKQKKIDEFVDKVMVDIEKEKVDLSDYKYMLGQLENRIKFFLNYLNWNPIGTIAQNQSLISIRVL